MTFVKHFYTSSALVLVLLLSYSYADWETDADARIESIRKRNAQISVVGPGDNPLPNINVQIEQIKHRFGFGTCISNSRMSNTDYKDFILNHFEWAVCENETKWPSNEPWRDYVTYTSADAIYSWCAANGIKMRGHCLFWEQPSNVQSWVQALPYALYPASSELLSEVDERLDGAVPHFKDKFLHWDVDNEMLSDSFYDRLGEAGRVHMFQYANQIDPNCKLFMNEYSGNSFGGYSSYAYASRANSLISLGAPIHGLGIQGHLGARPNFRPADYYNYVLQPLAAVNRPIWVSEFDANEPDDSLRANILEDFYRICFSHASVEGILMWGFWEGTTWQSDWWLVNSDWTLNQTGQRYEALMNEWTTNDANNTDINGNVNFRGFHGTYQLTLSAPGEVNETYIIELEPGTTTASFVIESYISPGEDPDPPTPNPMTWASLPTATGPSSISMTATTASDISPPVQYYFECANDANMNSDWQTDTAYVARNLSPNTQYTFRVKARDNDVNLNETGWSSEESATTLLSSTQVQIAGSWIAGLSHTKEAGYNRVLVFIAHAEEAGPISLSSVTYGGQPMTKVIEKVVGTTTQSYIAAYILNEAGIAAATSTNFAPSWSTTPDNNSYSSVFFSNVDQTGLFGAIESNDMTIVPPAPATITTNPLNALDGDMVVTAASCGYQSTYTTLNNGFTKAIDLLGSSSAGVGGYKPATGGPETPSASHDYVNREVIIGFVIKAGALTCNDIQSGGFGLMADLNGDCYVDYQDLDIMSGYWLNSNCSSFADCDGSDFEPDGDVDFFDFRDFASQWMQCNNPQDADCQSNW